MNTLYHRFIPPHKENRMSQLMTRLTEVFSKDQIKVLNEYHVQVKAPDGYHNIWISRDHQYKLKMCKRKQTVKYNINNLIRKLRQYSHTESELAQMEVVLDFTQFMQKSMNLKTNGIYVDAGWKNGTARIAAIVVKDDHVASESFVVASQNSLSAEVAAITFAIGWKPFEYGKIPIFSDSKSAIDYIRKNNVHSDDLNRIMWISRNKNCSDVIGNLRAS